MAEFIEGLVSIVTPAYNSASFVAEMIDSVLQQSYSCWELIIVDDGSKDDTFEICSRYAQSDDRIRVLKNSRNMGPAGARNVAVLAARGQYLAYLDSDDLWEPSKLEVQLTTMRRDRIAFSFTSYTQFSGDGVEVSHSAPARVDYRSLLQRNVIGCLTVVLDRNQIQAVPLPTMNYEDYATWLQILRTGEVAYGIPQKLARYRVTKNSASSRKFRSAVWVWKIYRGQERLSFAQSAWNFCHYVVRSLKRKTFCGFLALEAKARP